MRRNSPEHTAADATGNASHHTLRTVLGRCSPRVAITAHRIAGSYIVAARHDRVARFVAAELSREASAAAHITCITALVLEKRWAQLQSLQISYRCYLSRHRYWNLLYWSLPWIGYLTIHTLCMYEFPIKSFK